MTINDLIEKIKQFEGFSSLTYTDAGQGILTIGYGRTENVQRGDITTREIEDEWLYNKVKNLENTVRDFISKRYSGYTDEMIYALVDFTYNCGWANFLKLTDMGTRDLKTIGDKILLYNKAGGKELKGLTKRRQWENQIYFSKDMLVDNKPKSKEMIFEIQAFYNHIIKDYNLPYEKIVTDGIYGPKTHAAILALNDCMM